MFSSDSATVFQSFGPAFLLPVSVSRMRSTSCPANSGSFGIIAELMRTESFQNLVSVFVLQALFLLAVVLELAVVHDLTDRRFLGRRNLDQVQTQITRPRQGLKGWYDPELFAVFVNDAHRRNSDTLIHSGIWSSDESASFVEVQSTKDEVRSTKEKTNGASLRFRPCPSVFLGFVLCPSSSIFPIPPLVSSFALGSFFFSYFVLRT